MCIIDFNMKNKDIKDIQGFKDRIKILYEYRMVDLNPSHDNLSIQVNEDETENKQDNQQQSQVNKQETPVQQVAPPQPKPADTQTQQPIVDNNPSIKQQDNTELINFLKNEMSRLETVVNSIQTISSKVEELGNRMSKFDNSFNVLTKSIEEIREPSDIEKLEMRSFDSFPYNKSLTDVWKDKEKSKEEQELAIQGIRKTQDGYEMDYIPMQGMNFNKTDINQF